MTTALQKYATTLDTTEYNESRQAEEDQVRSGESPWIKFPQGTTVIRVLPAPMSWVEYFRPRGLQVSPFVKFWEHFYKAEESDQYISYVCPKHTTLPHQRGQNCPDCAEAWTLKNNSDGTADEQRAKDLKAKYKVACNVFVRSSTDPKFTVGTVKLWKMSAQSPAARKYAKEKGDGTPSRTMFEKLEALFLPRVGKRPRNIISPGSDGFDILVTRSGEGLKTDYLIDAADDPCELHEDVKRMEEILESQLDLPLLVRPPSQTELQQILGTSTRGGQSEPGKTKNESIDITSYIDVKTTDSERLDF